MDDCLSFEKRATYAFCHYDGPFELKELVEIILPILEYCKEQNLKSIVVDVTDSMGKMSLVHRFEHGIEMKRKWDLFIKIAVIAREDQTVPDLFWELVTRNRGLKTGVFKDIESALIWLEISSL